MALRMLALTVALAVSAACVGEVAPTDTPEVKASKAKRPRKGSKSKVLAGPKANKPDVDGPNVLVIVWDTTRADRLTPYGYKLDTTPKLAEFAKDAVLYERAVSPAMWTLPSHSSMFTGLPASAHGAASGHKWLDDRFLTFAEWFRDKGYDTYLFSANPYLQDHTNVGQGFEHREYPWDPKWKGKAKQATMSKVIERDASNSLAPQWKATTYPTGRTHDKVKDAGPVASEALFTWIDQRPDGDRPWLALLNYMETHVPRIPSMASREALFDAERIEKQLTLDQAFPFLLAYTTQLHEFTADEVETVSTTYDATLRDLDAATALLWEELERRGILDDTIVVLTADHGEHLGEHHRLGHKFSVYNPLVRVPLMIRYPARLKPARVSQIVSNLALFPTLTDLAGLPTPEGMMAKSLRDLDAQPEQAFSEMIAATPMALQRMSKVHKDFVWGPWERTYTSVEAPTAKCIQASDGERELYEMPGDLLETADLAPQREAEAAELCGRIDVWRESFETYDASKASKSDDPSSVKLSAEERARLEALGYVEEEE